MYAFGIQPADVFAHDPRNTAAPLGQRRLKALGEFGDLFDVAQVQACRKIKVEVFTRDVSPAQRFKILAQFLLGFGDLFVTIGKHAVQFLRGGCRFFKIRTEVLHAIFHGIPDVLGQAGKIEIMLLVVVQQGFAVIICLGNIPVVDSRGFVHQGFHLRFRPGQAVVAGMVEENGIIQAIEWVLEGGKTLKQGFAVVNSRIDPVVFIFVE